MHSFFRSTIFFHDKHKHRRAMRPTDANTPGTAQRPRAGLLRSPRRWLSRLWRMLRSIG